MKLDNFILGQSIGGQTVTRRVDRFLPVWEEKTTNGGLVVSEKICILKDGVTSATLAQKRGVYQIFNATENTVTVNIKTTIQEQLQPYTWLHADCDENLNFTVTKTVSNKAAFDQLKTDFENFKNHTHESSAIKWYRNDDLNTDSEFTSFDNTDFPDTGNDLAEKPVYWEIIPENIATTTKVVYFTYASSQNPVYVYNFSKTDTTLYIAESGETGEGLNNADGNSDFGIYNDYFTILPGEFIRLAYATQADFLWEKFPNQTLPLSLESLDQRAKESETKDNDFEARLRFIEERINAFIRESQTTLMVGNIRMLRFTGMKDFTNWRFDSIHSGIAYKLPEISEEYTEIGIFNNSSENLVIDNKESDGRILTQVSSGGSITFPEFFTIPPGQMFKYRKSDSRWNVTRHDNTPEFNLYNEILSLK